ncbi:hypothetical protein [Hymenobacter jeollabukensis]|uniref:Uncharacterized protein n=1 Tax=Hymenobacter jeollabukensis TaxID=2025313 RepID=A0A5R8WIK2_9BACT|nr:hypothetical protein [Hymenobacter jeollabukensis]TLM88709.1 hypothetical protein FDY95_23015 [Hymenobacter jeollabukensis]
MAPTLSKQQAVLGLFCLIVAAVFLMQSPPAWMQHLVIAVALVGSYRLAYGWLRYLWYAGLGVCFVGLAIAAVQLLTGEVPG